MSDEFVITIEETEDRIKARDLSKFLYSLRIAYYVGVKVSPENWNEYKKLFSEAWHNRDEFFESDLGEDDIYIARISKESPLKIGGRAKAIALAAALFIANATKSTQPTTGRYLRSKYDTRRRSLSESKIRRHQTTQILIETLARLRTLSDSLKAVGVKGRSLCLTCYGQ
jgi:hypothetical protein